MHALRSYLQSQLDSRGWQARDLVKASGLSRQLVSQMLNDDRDVMAQLPRTATLEAIARAFNVSVLEVANYAMAALGIDGLDTFDPRKVLTDVDEESLLRELLRRAVERQQPQPAASVEEVEAQRQTLLSALAESDARDGKKRAG